MLLILYTHGKGFVNTQIGWRDRCPMKALPNPLDLPGVPEPLLVLGRLLPALVGGSRADQVHVGAEVAAILARAFAGTIGAEAVVLRRQLLRHRDCLGENVAA